MKFFDIYLLNHTLTVFTCTCEGLQCCDREEAFDDCASRGRGGSHWARADTRHQCEARSNIGIREPEKVNK
jgi:hypothetical protein